MGRAMSPCIRKELKSWDKVKWVVVRIYQVTVSHQRE